MKIICFHQSADLYGSDRSFLQVVNYLKKTERYTDITVALPRTGPLAGHLEKLGVNVIFLNMSLLSKTYLKNLQWGKILFPLFQFKEKKKLIEQYDILYTNTSVILDFYLLAPFLKIKKILHIREIPSPWLSKILSAFIHKSGSLVIFNSYSTQDSFAKFKNSVVVHNAFEGYSDARDMDAFVPNLDTDTVNLLVIGRINSWKGQDFLISSLAKLTQTNYQLRVVGSTAAGNENVLVDLKQLVKSLNLEEKVTFVDFAEDPSDEYKKADVLIVPSIKPEPFGRIAIEAMSLGKPVIAANHGGLPEIVEHNDSGFLFEPGDSQSLNEFLSKYLDNRALVAKHGQAAKKIFLDKFSMNTMYKQLDKIFNDKPLHSNF
ncbi:glycosyltransferase family 4 protein [Dyadobacter alkalitolerans]|uniref:glycosyltransferase family 4 protein n=1 Tax=Dyadobacter alkalitolerans TaxID=492736 RepID=UPI000422EF6F|nr:glycosyltransferase family 4 protein [Dyadobacter alkalitolerans]